MREEVSRRKALSLLGIALGVALASTKDAEAQTTGTNAPPRKAPQAAHRSTGISASRAKPV